MSKPIQYLGGITITQAKTIAEILFGDRVIRVKPNDKTLDFEIYVIGEIDIPAEMQQRFGERLKQCKIIPLEKIEQQTLKKE